MRARSSVGLERMPPEHKVAGSIPAGRTDNKHHLLTINPL